MAKPDITVSSSPAGYETLDGNYTWQNDAGGVDTWWQDGSGGDRYITSDAIAGGMMGWSSHPFDAPPQFDAIGVVCPESGAWEPWADIYSAGGVPTVVVAGGTPGGGGARRRKKKGGGGGGKSNQNLNNPRRLMYMSDGRSWQ